MACKSWGSGVQLWDVQGQGSRMPAPGAQWIAGKVGMGTETGGSLAVHAWHACDSSGPEACVCA